MDHTDHVALLREGVLIGGAASPGAAWADLGSGWGAFTLALADLLGPGATITSVDRDARALAEQRELVAARFPQTRLTQITGDFTRPLGLSGLDGIVMANSLHFVRDKAPVLALTHGYLRPGGRLILVEYNADRGNPWVPWPTAFPTWQRIATAAGFTMPRLLATRPSRFLREIYSAACEREGA